MDCIRSGIAVYSSHTALDSAPEGISRELGRMLGLSDMQPLVPGKEEGTGLGIIGDYPSPVTAAELIARVKEVYNAPKVRVTNSYTPVGISRVALCSGSGGEFIAEAVRQGAQAYITSDVRYHDFLDFGGRILIIDTGHFESEICSRSIFSRVISEKFPNFAVHTSAREVNPVDYV